MENYIVLKMSTNKMAKHCLIALIGILFFTACSKNESNNVTPIAHDPVDIDINEDGIADYKLDYSLMDIEPLTLNDGTIGINGFFRAYGNNKILQAYQEKDLFLRDLGAIQENVVDPLRWSISSSSIVSIIAINVELEWPNEWKINADSEHSSYFLGLKLMSDSDIQLGWIEVEVDTNSGITSIVAKGIL